jgi:hypothetical protein
MELRPLKPRKSPKVKKIVYIDEASLLDKSDLLEQETIEWLTEFFDVYIVRADSFIHLLRGDYLISPIQYTPQFHGEWLSFLRKDIKDQEKPQIDWQRIKDYFMDVVERGENMDDADNDMTVLSMLRSKLRYDDENNNN